MGITISEIKDKSQSAVEKDFRSIFSSAKQILEQKVSTFSDEETTWQKIDQLWDRVDGEFEGGKDTQEFSKTFEEAVEKASNERLIGERNNILSIEFLERGLEVKKSIGIINYPLGSGTGIFIGNGLLMTNHHVFSDPSKANVYDFQLGFEQNRIGGSVEGAYFEIDPSHFFITNKELDFTIVSVGKSNNGKTHENFGHLIPVTRTDFCKQGDSVSIIHHPNGETKSISLHDSIFVDSCNKGTHATYTGDTLKGSSGAPVFDQDWNFVALHRRGVIKKNSNGELLKKDGSTFKNKQDFDNNQHLVNWEANLGTWCDKIINYLKSQNFSNPVQKKILNDLLELWTK